MADQSKRQLAKRRARKRRHERTKGRITQGVVPYKARAGIPSAQQEAERNRAEAEPKTLTAIAFGDPAPSRSALAEWRSRENNHG